MPPLVLLVATLSLPEWVIQVARLAWDKPDWFIFGIPVILGAVFAVSRWLLPRLNGRQSISAQRPEASFAFEVIKPESQDTLRQLMGADQAKDDPLADFNIPYQLRRRDLSVREQLEGLLDVHRWLLILGRTGLGKTREAAELATTLNHEGWTVLKLKNHELLTVPTRFPAELLGQQPRLLFFLDNVNQAMSLGKVEPDSTTQATLVSVLKQPLPERLQQTLEFYECHCGVNQVRVIATARNETLPEKPGQPSEWEKLGIEKYPKFWQQFCHHSLQDPEPLAIANVLAQTTEQAHLPAKTEDFAQIAQRGDGTFRNVVENLDRARNRRLTVSINTYKDTLKGTWQSRYQAAIERDKIARHIYDAVDVLRQCNVELQEFVVLPTAALLAQKPQPWQVWYRWKLRKALQYLDNSERILQPRDGQIEVKGYTIELGENLTRLTQLLVNLARQHPQNLKDSLSNLVVVAILANRYPEGLALANCLVQIAPDQA